MSPSENGNPNDYSTADGETESYNRGRLEEETYRRLHAAMTAKVQATIEERHAERRETVLAMKREKADRERRREIAHLQELKAKYPDA